MLFGMSNIAFADMVTKEAGNVSVSASVVDEVEPTQAVITFSILTNNKNLQKATDELNELSSKLSNALKNKVQSDDSIKTLTYSIAPRYTYTNKKKIFDTYEATTKLILTTKHIDTLPAIVSVALANGANQVDDLSFGLTNYDEKCNELIAKATKQSYKNALSAVSALGARLDGVKNLNTYCSTQNNSRVYATNMAKMSVDSASGAESMSVPTIESGTIKINANVNASFYVK